MPYEYTEIKTVKVNIDYHVQFDQHLYSVPHHLVGERLELHAKAYVIELYFHHQRVPHMLGPTDLAPQRCQSICRYQTCQASSMECRPVDELGQGHGR